MSFLSLDVTDSSTMLYVLPFVVLSFVGLFIPSLMVTGAKPEGVAKAICCYMWKTIGLVIMGMSVVQITYGVVTNQLPDYPVLGVLLLFMMIGIGIMVHISRVVAGIDEASSVVPRLVFTYTCEVIGGLIALFSALTMGIGFLLTSVVTDWEMPSTMLLLGLVLMLASSLHTSHKSRRSAKKARRK